MYSVSAHPLTDSWCTLSRTDHKYILFHQTPVHPPQESDTSHLLFPKTGVLIEAPGTTDLRPHNNRRNRCIQQYSWFRLYSVLFHSTPLPLAKPNHSGWKLPPVFPESLYPDTIQEQPLHFYIRLPTGPRPKEGQPDILFSSLYFLRFLLIVQKSLERTE